MRSASARDRATTRPARPRGGRRRRRPRSGARYSPKTSRSAPGPLAGGPPAWARAMVAAITFRRAVVLRRPPQVVEGPGHRRPVASGAATRPHRPPARPRRSGPPSRRRRPRGRRSSGEGAVSVKQLTPTTVCSPDSMRRTRSAWLRTRRAFSSSMAAKAPPRPSTSSSSAVAASTSSAVLASTTVRAVEDVVVLEKVGLEGQDLLDPQRPLLVPGSGQAEGLVPRRELDGPGPGALGQGDAEGLQDDPGHVVLGLLLGQAEGVHLHPVAEAAQLRVVNAVALGADPVPEWR